MYSGPGELTASLVRLGLQQGWSPAFWTIKSLSIRKSHVVTLCVSNSLPIRSTLRTLPFFFCYCSRGLPVDRCTHRERGQPMCMEQYYRLFTSYRIPGTTFDSLQTIAPSREPDYIIIIHRGQVFIFPLFLFSCFLLVEILSYFKNN